MKTIQYYFSPKSPWTYLGHERLLSMAKRHGANIEPKPTNLGKIFPLSGGLPLEKRAPQRQAYRIQELTRWSQYLKLPLNIHPKFFPVDDTHASLMIAATIQAGDIPQALSLSGRLLAAVWAENQDIADSGTLIQIANEVGLDGAALHAGRQAGAELYEQYTQQATELQVFGAPWYVYQGESFWGQDRLDFLDRALAG
ncbi:2-hydroxychromene-2-carboxylate isomerase [Pollutimonas harenae]|uniref:2-hydroxychromene-2-carboxylate isomerase n=1 Tax=Pollutimonas harenae TaxID=657015 RepID=A0A853H370_9BURK|nr:2-hydroxychromene-2-carboxylate isomerase [Pollutimonas harenae]NYT86470.1 2-hydroxychromene-2-carboxylate isomerase [Pollutimonas harenae]TEA69784.1 2-hydroxychromene-2-carboxylate isomerase [Pollutimonas harenae]